MKPRLPAGAAAAAFASTALIAEQVAGKATRDAFYLSNFGPGTLPPMMGAAALLSLASAFGVARLLTRHPPAKVVPAGLGLGAGCLLALWALSLRSPALAAVGLYVYTALFGAVMISAFWSLVNEMFDPHTSRRAVTAITSGATLGGLLGGVVAWRLSSLVSVPTMMPVLACINLACMVACSRLRAAGLTPARAALTSEDPALPLQVLRDTPYLRNLAAIVGLGAVTSGLLDFVFNVEASRVFAKGPALLSFFAVFWVAVGLLSFLLQITLGRIAIEKLGLAFSVGLLPAVVLLGGVVGLVVPGIPSMSLLRGSEAAQRNSLFRSAYEMLYTPLSEAKKRAAKTVIDVAFDRAGTVVAAGLAWLAVLLAGPRAELLLLAAAMLVAALTLARSRPLHLGYISVLEEQLRRGAGGEGAVGIPAPTRREDASDGLEIVLSAEDPAPPNLALAPRDGLSPPAFRDLTSTDPERVRRALSGTEPLARTLVAFALLKLGDTSVRAAATQALRRTAPHIPGQLSDALCDPDLDFRIRRRIPSLLAACPTQRVAEALLEGAQDDSFPVRAACGRALLRITRDNPRIVVGMQRVIRLIQCEASLDRGAWSTQQRKLEVEEEDDDPDELSSPLDRLIEDRVDRTLEHVFNLLALEVDRASLAIAFKALHGKDDRQRGTALEYLETMLPDEVRELVWPLLGKDKPLARSREAVEILADLERMARPLTS